MVENLGVAEAKRRFSELIERVRGGERFLISRRGKPAVALVPPSEELTKAHGAPPTGLAAIAGALADWDDLALVVEEVYSSRNRAKDRPVPKLD